MNISNVLDLFLQTDLNPLNVSHGEGSKGNSLILQNFIFERVVIGAGVVTQQ